MTTDVLAATLVAPGQLELRRYPYPERLEPGAVLLRMLASGICGTDKHTFLGETQQYAGTDHATTTPFPIIQGHENVGVVAAIGDGGATAFDGTPLTVGDRVVVAPNRTCGECEYCRGDYPYYFCRRIENYGNSLTSTAAPHLFGGWSEYLYVLPGTHLFAAPDRLPTHVAVLTELFAVTHSLELVARVGSPRVTPWPSWAPGRWGSSTSPRRRRWERRVSSPSTRSPRASTSLATSGRPTPSSPAATIRSSAPRWPTSRGVVAPTSSLTRPVTPRASARRSTCCVTAAR
jgi:hypothetical protein